MMDPFLVPIAEVKAVEVKKPESRPAVVENRQKQAYNLSDRNLVMSEVQRNAPPIEAVLPPERRYGVKIAALAAGKREKVLAGKPQGREGQVIRGGDDCAFSIRAPESNPNGLICFGADFDGVSQGGRGDEASIVAARGLYSGIEGFLNQPGQLNRDEIAVEVAKLIAAANKQVFEEGQKSRSMATTLSLFGLQKSGGKLYLHSWNTGDSVTMVYVQTEAGQEFLYPVTIPQDPIGEAMLREQKFEDLYADKDLQLRIQAPDSTMTIDRLQKEYRDAIIKRRSSLGQYGPQIVEQELVTVSNVVGFKPKAVVDYTRVSLPQIGEAFKGSPVRQLKIAGMSDGIENYSTFDQQLQAFRQSSANGAAMALLELGNAADADDRSVVAAEVAQTKEVEALSVEETSAISAIEVMVGLEKTSGSLDREKLKESFLMARLTFGKLPQASRVRTEIMKNVIGQLGSKAEELRKSGKTEQEIFNEWLKRVFIPLYRRARKR